MLKRAVLIDDDDVLLSLQAEEACTQVAGLTEVLSRMRQRDGDRLRRLCEIVMSWEIDGLGTSNGYRENGEGGIEKVCDGPNVER